MSETLGKMSYILLLDKDSRTIQIVTESLNRHKFSVRTISNCAEALSQMDLDHPSLLIAAETLLGAKSAEGWDFIARLRSDPDLADLPVIVLTARPKTDGGLTGYQKGEERQTGLQLAKPFNPQELLSFVRRFLS